MKYVVKISVLVSPTEGEKYPTSQEIYEQQIEDLDIAAVIKAANKFV